MYKDEQWLRQKYEVEKISAVKIAKLCDVDFNKIYKQMDIFGIVRGKNINIKNKNATFEYRDKNWLRKMYLDNKYSARYIGDLCNVTESTILSHLKKFNIPRRDNSDCHIVKDAIIKYKDNEWLIEQYKTRGIRDICKECNVDYEVIKNKLIKLNIPLKSISEVKNSFTKEKRKTVRKNCSVGQLKLNNKKNPDLRYMDKDFLIEHYIDKCLSTNDIGIICSVHGACISNWIDYYNIPKRNNSESTCNSIIEKSVDTGKYFHGNTKLKTGKFYSNKNKKELRFRSSYEETVFNILEDDNDVLNYESESFKIPYYYNDEWRNFIPDLKINYKNIDKPVVVEVKPKRILKVDKKVQAKHEYAEPYCEEHDMLFFVWTEKEINEQLGYKKYYG